MKKNVKNAAAIVLLAGFAVLVLGCLTLSYRERHARGMAAYNNRDFHLAIEEFTEGLNRRPGHSVLHRDRGRAHLAAGNHAQAIEDLEIAARANWYPRYAQQIRQDIATATQRQQQQLAQAQRQQQVARAATAPAAQVAQTPATGQQQVQAAAPTQAQQQQAP